MREVTKKPVTVRPATGEERTAAVKLAKELRMVTYPDRAKVKVDSTVPPGKLRIRALVQREQQRQSRTPITAEPFRRLERVRTIHTPITVGIMCDVSGSMSQAQTPLAVARWVLADALHQVNGTVATVLFGAQAHPIQAPHEHQHNIEIYHAGDGWENYVDAFSLIDSALQLIDGYGARLLVCITDGHFNDSKAVEYAEITMDMCRRSGVAVVWVDVSNYFARDDCYGHGTLIQAGELSAVQFANVLGRAVIDEFKRAAPQHSAMVA
jgi:hypothetical protein